MNSLFINWKTGLAGAVTALVPVINAALPVIPPQYASIVTGIVAGIGLICAKDFNVTGGTSRQ